MNKIIYFLFFLIIVKTNPSVAQDEGVVPLSNNPVLINEWKKINSGAPSAGSRIQSATNDTLLLPFIDDFANQYMFPDPALWQDSAVFINADFPRNPPTIGVATFDGLNRFGNPYVAAVTNNGSCDTLTSKPLNTEDDGQGNTYNPSSGLFLSFFYEQKGWGDRPESGDYLYLEFFNPVTNAWVSPAIWSVDGTPSAAEDSTFTRVQIQITHPDYFHKGFRFRFRTYGSRTGNVDHWHVDYVTLKAPPNFPDINDVAYVTPGQSLLNGLTSMPYTHYKSIASPSTIMLNNIPNVKVFNNYSLDKICAFVDEVYDPSGTQIYCNGCTPGSNNFQVNAHSKLYYNFPFSSFEYPNTLSQSTAAFDVVNHIASNTGSPLDDNPQNDTIHYLQKFYNYYAHDDGTCELGYNLNVSGASLAYKFHIYKADDLHAIQFYFTQIGASVANQLFNITVWNDAGGVPGSVLYQKMNQVPSYSNIVDGFVTYAIPSWQFTPGDYYFGFIQVGNVGLELGYDANVDALPANKYYKTNGGWTQLVIPGSWMIRPVFSPYPFNVEVNEILPVNILSVYPNPVSSALHIDYNTEGKKFQYELMDASGRVIVRERLSENSIDVSKFMNGFYVIRVFDAEKKNIFQQKVIVHH